MWWAAHTTAERGARIRRPECGGNPLRLRRQLGAMPPAGRDRTQGEHRIGERWHVHRCAARFRSARQEQAPTVDFPECDQGCHRLQPRGEPGRRKCVRVDRVDRVDSVDQVEIALGKAARPEWSSRRTAGRSRRPRRDRGGLPHHVEEIAEPEELVGESDHGSRVARSWAIRLHRLATATKVRYLSPTARLIRSCRNCS